MHTIIGWLIETIGTLGYPGIFLLMAVESSVIPFPSEVVMPPAGYLVFQGKMNPWLVVLAGGLGSLVGAYANYYGALYLGRPLLLQYGRFVGLAEVKLDKAELFFRRHGEISTFIGRLLPVIRQLISVPAGLARMNHARFALYTALGASIWCAVLTWVGYAIGDNQQLIMSMSRQATAWAIGFCLLILTIYLHLQRQRSNAGNLLPVTSSTKQSKENQP
ncbi:MAG: DedA family protein [Trichlorobacter sp.]|uniref:DedA family protein n=1 Tax=Trichlorobacter sp. TaxID=2911007 RepID=UPI00256157B3|nr:DedA family protein [Trichlorobacter sp.]MDK9717086.1 DedA family protein [Trichlorobacter sp.]